MRTHAFHLVIDVVTLVTDGYAATRVVRHVGPRAYHGSGGGEIRGVLEGLRPRSVQRLRRGLVDPRERVPPDRSVDLLVTEFRSFDLAVGVVGLDGGGGRLAVGGVGLRGGVARGCLRGGGVGEVRRHEVPHLVACSVVVGAVLRAVVVRAGVRLRRRVPGVRVLLLLRVHCAQNTFITIL